MASPGQMLLQGSQPALCTLSRGLLRLRGNQPLMTLEPGSPAALTFVPQVYLAAGAEAGSQAQEEVSQKRSQVGRQANSEPALHPPETELPEAAFLLQSMSLFRMERGRRWGNPPCRTFCDPPLYVKSCLFFWPALLQLEILLSVFGFVKTQPT